MQKPSESGFLRSFYEESGTSRLESLVLVSQYKENLFNNVSQMWTFCSD